MTPRAARGRVIVALLFTSTVIAAADEPAPLPVHTVRIDAIAVDRRGRFVEDLKLRDFELREDGAVRPLDSVELTRAAGPRLFALFLDEYHVSRESANDTVRASLKRFVTQDLAPRDLLVVMKPLDSLFTIKLSEDREAALRSIEAFEGRRGDYEPRNAYERNYIAGTPARIDVARAQVAVSAMNALAIHLGSLGDSRKTLIVVTEGVGRADRRRGQEYLPTFDTVTRSANRSIASIYFVDPRPAPEADATGDAMRALASDTDGRAIITDLDDGLRRASADATAYYMLSYRAPHAEDGAFHHVEVQVKRAGVQLRARKGYWAPSPDDVLRASLLERLNAPPAPPKPLPPPRHVSTLIRPWFGVSRGDAGKTRVTVVWEPAARVPGDRGRRYPSQVTLQALMSDGTVLFEGPLVPTGPAMAPSGATPSRAVFEAPPGRIELRMAIQDAAAQLLDSDVRDLAVPDFKRPVSIGTPEILRSRTAREFRMLDAAESVPVAAREFSRAERLLIRFPAYGPGDAVPKVSAKLLSRNGQTMRDLIVEQAPAPGAANEIDLPLASFAAGEYMIELTATTSAGEAKDRIAFRVTS